MARRFTLVAAFVTIGFVAGLVLTGGMRTADESIASQEPPQGDGSAAPAVQPARGGLAAATPLPDLTAVAERAVASVTNISSTRVVRRSMSPFANDPFYQFFFGDEAFGYRDRREQSLGSGVVVTRDGYVLTNNHVVGSAGADVTVVLSDKRELPATVVGIDEWTDLAVLKLDAGELPVLPWGDSSKLRVAEWVLAIGNPYQLSETVTLGIVSATGRSMAGQLARYEDFIQTDAAINPGNSGGALVSARGELVGINTAIYSESGGYQGIGFAVPSNLARHVMDDLIKFGEVRRGTILGIRIQHLTPQLARQLGAPNTKGTLVYQIDDRTDAYREGLRAGDIIVRFNKTEIDDPSHFIRLLADARIGSTVTLEVLSEGRTRIVRVPVEQAPRARARRR